MDLGGEGAEPPPPPLRQVITQKKAKLCCSQTVKSNILLSQTAGNAISETLDVQTSYNRARALPLTYAVPDMKETSRIGKIRPNVGLHMPLNVKPPCLPYNRPTTSLAKGLDLPVIPVGPLS